APPEGLRRRASRARQVRPPALRGRRHRRRDVAAAVRGRPRPARQRAAGAGAGPHRQGSQGAGRRRAAPAPLGSAHVNLITLAAAAALRLLDPTGDAAGDGTLMPPTSPAYANASLFDLQEVALTPGATEGEPATLTVAMGSIELSDALP